MSSVDKLKGKLKNNKTIERLIKMEARCKEIIKDDNYLKDIEENIQEKGILASYYDYDNPCELEILYNVINEYASKNYIYPYSEVFENYYIIKFNNKMYKISMMSGQGFLFYVELIKNNEDYMYIDYDDIKSNKKQVRACDIDNKFAKINVLIDTLNASGLSIIEIRNIINDYIDKIEHDKENIKYKQLKR